MVTGTPLSQSTKLPMWARICRVSSSSRPSSSCILLMSLISSSHWEASDSHVQTDHLCITFPCSSVFSDGSAFSPV